MTVDDILELAEAYAAHRGLTLGTVSTYATNDGKRFDRLKAGRSCTLLTAARLIQWFSDRWPADLAWPPSIPRPTGKREAA